MGSPDANRARGRASGTPATKRGWLGKRAWQDIRRASSIAVADGAYSCEIHGVRYVYRRQKTMTGPGLATSTNPKTPRVP